MYYFASDIHLGAGRGGNPADKAAEARETEAHFLRWLREVGRDAQGIFLVGDIFDFWFEYEYVVPKGFVRVLAQIAALTDSGVRVVYMSGNHDMWLGSYLSLECGVEIYTKPTTFTLNGSKVHVAHGDNLNVEGDIKLRAINAVFRSEIARKLFSRIVHPDLALRFGNWWSDKSRSKHGQFEGHNTLDGRGVRALLRYAEEHQRDEACDYYIYGHLHQTISHKTSDESGANYEVLFMNDWSGDPHYIAMNDDGVAEILKA